MTRSSTSAGTALALVIAALAGCGGTSAAPNLSQTPTAASSSAVATSGGPTPAATESNPPGDIPDNQVYVAFSAPGGQVSVKVPEGWARSTVGAETVFSDKLNHIAIATATTSVMPTLASVSQTDIPKLQGSVPNFAPGKVTEVRRAGGTAILVTYQSDSAVDPVTGRVVRDASERYIFYRAGRRLDLTLSGPKNADNVDPWRTVSDSVQWR